MMFSSIEVEEREKVIKRCYWPLLELASKRNYCIGIEATGISLEAINEISPEWIIELKSLIQNRSVEFIGSGYSQLIGTLVPIKVVQKNLELGNNVYSKLLGFKPKIALVNEQSYNNSIISAYLDNKYESIIVEWNNSFSSNEQLALNSRYHPIKVKSPDTREINVIWNDSTAFQFFQRYVHDEISLSTYQKFLDCHISKRDRSLALYGSDAEIFNFRPGRFSSESKLEFKEEWERIKNIYKMVDNDNDYTFIFPSEVLANEINIKSIKRLESPDFPVLVKKQLKYNIYRWALSGEIDYEINLKCYKCYKLIEVLNNHNNNLWKEMCYLWSSDYRTHITKKRQKYFQKRLNDFHSKLIKDSKVKELDSKRKEKSFNTICNFKVQELDGFLTISNEYISLILNLRKGLSIFSYKNKKIYNKPLIGTILQGHFNNINWSADFYSGHLTYDRPGKHKITDLVPVKPTINNFENKCVISALIKTYLGDIKKDISIYFPSGDIRISYEINWEKSSIGSLRIANITLLPDVFNKNELAYSINDYENIINRFELKDNEINHGESVSSLVSATTGFGLPDGNIRIDDKVKFLDMSFDPFKTQSLYQIRHQQTQIEKFTRISLSCKEYDDTSKASAIAITPEVNLSFGTIKH